VREMAFLPSTWNQRQSTSVLLARHFKFAVVQGLASGIG
jgi:hypothetical protein